MKKLLSILAIASMMVACNNAKTDDQVRAAKQAAIDSMNMVQAQQQQAEADRQRIIDSMNMVAASRPAKVVEHRTTVVRSSESGHAAYSEPATTTTTTTETKKKGWTGATKGAIIGAGAGAITGAMVDGRKGEGAIVGGLLGAGAGAATGAIIDKEKKKKQARQQAEQNK